MSTQRLLVDILNKAPYLEDLVDWTNPKTQEFKENYIASLKNLIELFDSRAKEKDINDVLYDEREIMRQFFVQHGGKILTNIYVIAKLNLDEEVIKTIEKVESIFKINFVNSPYILYNFTNHLHGSLSPFFNNLTDDNFKTIFSNQSWKTLLRDLVLNMDKKEVKTVFDDMTEDTLLKIVKFMKEDKEVKFDIALNLLSSVALTRGFEVAVKEFEYDFSKEFLDLIKILEKKGQKDYDTEHYLNNNLIYLLMNNKLEPILNVTVKDYLNNYGDDETAKISNKAKIELFNLLQEKNCYKSFFKFEDSLGKANYNQNVSKGLIDYVINEGSYEEFTKIAVSKNRYQLGFFPNDLKENPNHNIESTSLYQLALTSQREKFNYLLKNLYTYENQTLQEYLNYQKVEKLNDSHTKEIYNVIFKDELKSLKIALESQKEYSMLEALNEFEESYTKKKIKHTTENKVKEERHKNSLFLKLVDFFNDLFAAKVETKKENNNLNEQQVFIREMNENSTALNDKLNFLSRKIKINSPLTALHKDEVLENIKEIRKISSTIEAMLEKEYSIKHVEAFIAYKNLTNKYFVKAVEAFIQANDEMKLQNIEVKENVEDFAQEFRQQVKFIKDGLDDVRNKISTDRKNDLLDEMKSDTALLKMKANA